MNDSREQEINNLINSLTTNNEVNNSVQNNDLINSLTTPNSNMNTVSEQNPMPQENIPMEQGYNNVPEENVMMQQEVYNNVPQENVVMQQEVYNNVPQENVVMQQEVYNNVPQENVVMQQEAEYNNVPQENTTVEQTVTESPTQNNATPTPVETNNNPQDNKPKQAVSSNTKTVDSNLDKDFGDTLISAYVGKNYEKISRRKFNFAAFFLTAFYLFYRKNFFFGILFVVVPPILFAIFPDYVLFVAAGYLIASIVIGFTFNKNYITKGNAKIYKFKLENLHASLAELKTLCANEGGTAFGNIFAGLATTTVLLLASNYVLNNMFNISLWDNIFYNYKYEGVIIYDENIDIEKSFVVTIPNDFKKDVTSGLYEYAYSKTKGKGKGKDKTKANDQCKVTFNALQLFRNDKRLITQMKEFYKDSNPSKVIEQETNGITWYGFSITNSFGKYYYYATKYEDRIYLYTFQIMDQTSQECESFSKGILFSIKEKKVIQEELKKQKAEQQNNNNQTKQTEQSKKK